MTENKHELKDNVSFGFWVYLMTDLLMFAVLFATYAVLRNSTYGSISIQEIFNPPFVLIETFILLISSYTCGIATLYLHKNNKKNALILFVTTVFLGFVFLGMEFYEFGKLLSEGNSPDKSAFLSAFFTIVGTHGLHIVIGSLWLIIIIIQIMRKGMTASNIRKATMAGIFWHFLDVVWIFIFTIVYLFGGIL